MTQKESSQRGTFASQLADKNAKEVVVTAELAHAELRTTAAKIDATSAEKPRTIARGDHVPRANTFAERTCQDIGSRNGILYFITHSEEEGKKLISITRGKCRVKLRPTVPPLSLPDSLVISLIFISPFFFALAISRFAFVKSRAVYSSRLSRKKK